MIYLDNSATTRPFDSVIDAMDRCMREQYFNASAGISPPSMWIGRCANAERRLPRSLAFRKAA